MVVWKNLFVKIILVSILLSSFAGCILQRTLAPEELHLATTTETCDTGLLDVLSKKFEEMNNVKIITACVGTGRAIEIGEHGEADIVMAHSIPDELKAVANGSLIDRRYLMYDYFVIIGPESDPAGIKSANNESDAFRRIATKQSIFISRGDDSGTNQKEKSIWEAANIIPVGTWYQPVNRGMAETITIANAKGGYTLSDKGTYLVMKNKINLKILFERDQLFLFNPYHVMAVNPVKFSGVKYNLAMRYIDYVTSPEGQNIIRNYGKDEYGEALFIPAANASEN